MEDSSTADFSTALAVLIAARAIILAAVVLWIDRVLERMFEDRRMRRGL